MEANIAIPSDSKDTWSGGGKSHLEQVMVK